MLQESDNCAMPRHFWSARRYLIHAVKGGIRCGNRIGNRFHGIVIEQISGTVRCAKTCRFHIHRTFNDADGKCCK